MTTIRTSCLLCGDVELVPTGDVELVPTDLRLELLSSTGTGSYLFLCPHCDEEQRRPANHRVVSILLATGVAYEVVDHNPITEQEISDFSKALDRADWSEQLRS
jgi:hypothetical protein